MDTKLLKEEPRYVSRSRHLVRTGFISANMHTPRMAWTHIIPILMTHFQATIAFRTSYSIPIASDVFERVHTAPLAVSSS